MQKNIVECIGQTPLIALQHINASDCEIYVKLESRNPGGSVKDRIAKHMLGKALAEGRIGAGGTLIEPTSGNTGIALAMLAAANNLRCCIAMPESMSIERQKIMRGYGAELILTPAKEGMQGAVNAAEQLLAKTDNAFMPNQFANDYAVQAHYLTTGSEILRQTLDISEQSSDVLDVLVAGVGTGSTLSGCGLFLREQLPNLRIVAVEPLESPLLSQGKSAPHGIQGIGANFVPPILRLDIIDSIYTVGTEDALATARALQSKEGISAGISSGANVFAALQLAKQPEMCGKRIVTFICDGAERYMSTALFA